MPITLALKVQLPFAGMVAPLMPMLPPFAAAATVPPHVVLVEGDAATTIPVGRLSVTATPVTGVASALVKVICKRAVCPKLLLVVELPPVVWNALDMPKGFVMTPRLDVAPVSLVTPSVV